MKQSHAYFMAVFILAAPHMPWPVALVPGGIFFIAGMVKDWRGE